MDSELREMKLGQERQKGDIFVINQMLLLWYHAFKIHMELSPDKSLLL